MAPEPDTRAERTPLISIVVPSFNQGRWIDAALRSLLDQGDRNLEVIVVDGGSTDGTRAILERHAPRLAACVIEPDGGQADALNKGFLLARGEILGWLNSDDLHLPWTLATVRSAFSAAPDIDFVHGDRVIVDGDGTVIGYRQLPGHSRYLLSRWPWTHQETCFWRRPLAARCGGLDRDLRFALDYDLFARFFRAGRCRHLPLFLAGFRWHPESKSFALQSTVGAREIELVRRRYDVMPRWWERPIGTGYSVVLRGLARWHRLRPHRPPQRPTRVGFPIDELWRADATTSRLQGRAA